VKGIKTAMVVFFAVAIGGFFVFCVLGRVL